MLNADIISLNTNAKNKLNIVMYHYVRDLKRSLYPDIKGLDTDLFIRQLDFFEENYNIVAMEEVLAAVNKGAPLPENPMLLTFDDGYIDHFNTAFPILKNRGLQGSFFIPGKIIAENVLLDVNKIHFILAKADSKVLFNEILSLLNRFGSEYPELLPAEELAAKYSKPNRYDDAETVFCKRTLQTGLPEDLRNKIAGILFEKYVGIPEENFANMLYMNAQQVECMKKCGMFIGLHGYDHYWLGNLSEEEMKNDIERALDVMSGFIDRDNWVMNYPYGSFNENVVKFIAENGCRLGLTTECGSADLNRNNPLLLPRFDCNDFPPKSENYLNLS